MEQLDSRLLNVATEGGVPMGAVGWDWLGRKHAVILLLSLLSERRKKSQDARVTCSHQLSLYPEEKLRTRFHLCWGDGLISKYQIAAQT